MEFYCKTLNKTMNYSQYLFGQLLQAKFVEVGSIPYDELYPLTMELYTCFEDSDENIDTRSEYDCMERYITNNETFLLESIKGF